MGWFALSFGLMGVVLVACSSSEPAVSPAPDGKAQSCTPGQQTSCTCAGGATGFQVCDASGASFGSCQCSSDGNDAASSADTGGSDAGSDTGTNDAGNDAAVPIPTNGLVAYYRGDGKDKSGNSNDLTGGMKLITDRFGGSQAGKIVSQSQEGYLVRASHPLIPTGNQPFSISVWGRSAGGRTPLLNWGVDVANNSSHLGIAADRTVYFYSANGAMVVSAAQWHHVALTFNGATASLFIDTVPDVSTAMQFTSGSGGIAIGDVCIPVPGMGCNATSPTELGSIDDVRVYNRVLTQPEIDALYHEVK